MLASQEANSPREGTIEVIKAEAVAEAAGVISGTHPQIT
jgi:hypothetical protein